MDAQRSRKHLADDIGRIQEARSEYLEMERTLFPRFYFVGDEDLLEIIGNNKNIPRLQKHFKNIFPGASAMILNEEKNVVLGMSSSEGEKVTFNAPVSTVKYPKINEWLTQVEKEMRVTLAQHLADAVRDIHQLKDCLINKLAFMSWCDNYEAQIVVLAAQIMWSEDVEAALQAVSTAGDKCLAPVQRVLSQVDSTLTALADSVRQEQPALRRCKLENLIKEFFHQRIVTSRLIASKITNPKSSEWVCQMRFYFDSEQTDILKQLSIHIADIAQFYYGFEYLGVQDRPVQTPPLTDRCFLFMTTALNYRFVGSLNGPSGTGKTESIKAFGSQLGRLVHVVHSTQMFYSETVGRIFAGLCQVGAWVCFDEFNRLEEPMLSAVSQQLQTTQKALRLQKENMIEDSLVIESFGKRIKVSQDVAFFITMNTTEPNYFGLPKLSENLKEVFRSMAMTSPDHQLIAEAILLCQGFRTAEKLAQKIILFFKICEEQLSKQWRYNFSLFALKSILTRHASDVKRDFIQKIREDIQARSGEMLIDEGAIAENLPEQYIISQSIRLKMEPGLVGKDILLFHSLLMDVFPGVAYTHAGV